MREYVTTLGSVMMMVSIAGILIPGGGIKKFASLAMGFMVITVAVHPLEKGRKIFEFDTNNFEILDTSLTDAETLYEENVLSQHEKNLEDMITAHLKYKSTVDVTVNETGEIDSVTLNLKGDESRAVSYIVETLRFPRERIKFVYENN